MSAPRRLSGTHPKGSRTAFSLLPALLARAVMEEEHPIELQALIPACNASPHAALLEAWLASCNSTATRNAYRADARHYLAYLDHTGLDLMNVSRKHLDLYACTRQPLDAPATLAMLLACISALYRCAQTEELTPTNPATLRKRSFARQSA